MQTSDVSITVLVIFRASHLEDIHRKKCLNLNASVRAQAAEYNLELLNLQYNTFLFNCEKIVVEMINFQLYDAI